MQEILSVFGIDWRLLLVQGFNFGVVLLVLSYVLYRPVLSLLAKRQAMITEGVKKAEAAEEELGKIARDKELILSDASRQAGIIIDRAKERGLEKESLILKEAQDRSVMLVREAQERAKEAERQALESAQGEMARMAVLGAEKILKERK